MKPQYKYERNKSYQTTIHGDLLSTVYLTVIIHSNMKHMLNLEHGSMKKVNVLFINNLVHENRPSKPKIMDTKL